MLTNHVLIISEPCPYENRKQIHSEFNYTTKSVQFGKSWIQAEIQTVYIPRWNASVELLVKALSSAAKRWALKWGWFKFKTSFGCYKPKSGHLLCHIISAFKVKNIYAELCTKPSQKVQEQTSCLPFAFLFSSLLSTKIWFCFLGIFCH